MYKQYIQFEMSKYKKQDNIMPPIVASDKIVEKVVEKIVEKEIPIIPNDVYSFLKELQLSLIKIETEAEIVRKKIVSLETLLKSKTT